MTYGFDTDFDATKYVPEKLRDYELYPKLVEMLNYIIQGYAKEFEDVRLKNSGPDQVSERVITEIIQELGFGYITDVMATISGFQFNSLLEFISLVNLLKGSRTGFELILKLLGFDSVITEWWEASPQGEPMTFSIIVIMNNTYVTNVQDTLDKVKIFTRAYVFPSISNIDFRFGFSVGTKNVTFFGFSKAYYSGNILARA
jgi:hypothetical protein